MISTTANPDTDEQSLAAVTTVLTCGLSSASASPESSTSTDVSHSQQKKQSLANKKNNKTTPAAEDPQSGRYLR